MRKNHYLNHFWLIQEGKINTEPNAKKPVHFYYMGAAEFEFGALDYSLTRIFSKYLEYEIHLTGITNPDDKELVLYCRQSEYKRILKLIKAYLKNPYYLKSYSTLEYIPSGKNYDTNFWWCIDKYDEIGDWMLFFEDSIDIVLNSILADYNQKWECLTQEEKRTLLERALRA